MAEGKDPVPQALGLPIPAKIEAVKVSLELCVEQVTDHVKRVARRGKIAGSRENCRPFETLANRREHLGATEQWCDDNQ